MLDSHRDKFLKLEELLAGVFERLPFSPNTYTLLSLVAAILGLWTMLARELLAATGLFLLAFLLDLVDGAVARAKNTSTKKGAYLDTITDRYVEAIVLFGLLFVPLPDVILPSFAWIFLAIFGSTMTTYAKAAAKEKGLSETELRGGLMSRGERVIVIFLILVLILSGNSSSAAYLLVLLALLANITALQRIKKALSR